MREGFKRIFRPPVGVMCSFAGECVSICFYRSMGIKVGTLKRRKEESNE
jgi:hypothetical protein